MIETWRKRVGVEPTIAAERRRPPVLKTGMITGPHALPCRPTTTADIPMLAVEHIRCIGLVEVPLPLLRLPNRSRFAKASVAKLQSVPRGTLCSREFICAVTGSFHCRSTDIFFRKEVEGRILPRHGDSGRMDASNPRDRPGWARSLAASPWVGEKQPRIGTDFQG